MPRGIGGDEVSLFVDAYEEDAEYTVLPLENTIYGPVTETLDCFFGRFNYLGTNYDQGDGDRKGKGKGKEKEIIATLDLPIRHCLVVKKGVKMEDISVVSSHEQVSLPFRASRSLVVPKSYESRRRDRS
jgi:prephenate dehydratase